MQNVWLRKVQPGYRPIFSKSETVRAEEMSPAQLINGTLGGAFRCLRTAFSPLEDDCVSHHLSARELIE